MTGDIDHELVPLSIVVAVVAIIRVRIVVLISVRILLHLIWPGGPQFQHLLLKGPSEACIVGKRRCDRLIGIFRPPIEVALQMLPVAFDNREIVRLHPLRPRIPDLVSVLVAVAGGLQTVGRSRLFQGPRPPGDVRLGWRSILGPTNMVFIRLCSEGGNAYSRNCNQNFDCYLQGYSSRSNKIGWEPFVRRRTLPQHVSALMNHP